MPETPLIEEVFDLHAEADGITRDQFRAKIECSTHLQRLPTLSELAEVATFVASDHARSMTGTIVNLSGGTSADRAHGNPPAGGRPHKAWRCRASPAAPAGSTSGSSPLPTR